MASRADGGSREGNAANPADDLDAGWDDAPESASIPVPAPARSATPVASPSRSVGLVPRPTTSRPPVRASVPARSSPARPSRLSPPPKPSRPPATTSTARQPTPSLPPVAMVPRPRSWTPPPPPLEDVREEDVSVEDARDEALLDAPARAEAVDAAAPDASATPLPLAGSVAPSDVELPSFERRKRGRKTFAAIVGLAAALAVASVGWSRFAGRGDRPAPAVAARAPEPAAPPRAPEPPPTPAPAAASPVAHDTVTAAPLSDPAAPASPEQAVTTVAVTIKTIPEDAVVFRARQRLGTGLVEVRVEPNTKQRFTALLDGYIPANFTLDGSRDAVTIRLKRPVKQKAAPAPESDPPSAVEPNTNAATPAAPTQAPAPAEGSPTPGASATAEPVTESPPPSAPSPEVPPSAPSHE